MAIKADQTTNTSLIIGIVQFFISVFVVLLFAVVPSGRMFGDRVAGKSRKYLANQTFTASYPHLDVKARWTSIALWFLIFGCKFTESYFFLTLSFKNPIKVMVGMKIQGCDDKLFGTALCRNQASFTLAIMFMMDLTLFFLDTFLSYIIWNTVFSVARSFALGLSIWTPWVDIYSRLPKRIYANVLATANQRFSSLRSGTPSSFPCIENISFRSNTFNNCSITRFRPITMANELSELRFSSVLKAIGRSLPSFSPAVLKRRGEFPSLPSR